MYAGKAQTPGLWKVILNQIATVVYTTRLSQIQNHFPTTVSPPRVDRCTGTFLGIPTLEMLFPAHTQNKIAAKLISTLRISLRAELSRF